jgi:hypothetical protein
MQRMKLRHYQLMQHWKLPTPLTTQLTRRWKRLKCFPQPLRSSLSRRPSWQPMRHSMLLQQH